MTMPSAAPITTERNSPAPARQSEATPLVVNSPLNRKASHASRYSRKVPS